MGEGGSTKTGSASGFDLAPFGSGLDSGSGQVTGSGLAGQGGWNW